MSSAHHRLSNGTTRPPHPPVAPQRAPPSPPASAGGEGPVAASRQPQQPSPACGRGLGEGASAGNLICCAYGTLRANEYAARKPRLRKPFPGRPAPAAKPRHGQPSARRARPERPHPRRQPNHVMISHRAGSRRQRDHIGGQLPSRIGNRLCSHLGRTRRSSTSRRVLGEQPRFPRLVLQPHRPHFRGDPLQPRQRLASLRRRRFIVARAFPRNRAQDEAHHHRQPAQDAQQPKRARSLLRRRAVQR